MTTPLNSAKAKLSNGEVVIAYTSIEGRDASAGRLAAQSGFDILLIDLEHGTISVDDAARMAIASLSQGVSSLVRLKKEQMADGQRLLENGVLGIMVPQVETAEEARVLVDAYRYPPIGRHGIGPLPPQLGPETGNWTDAMDLLNGETLLVAMIETATGVANIDAIAAVDGLDGLVVGGMDLSLDYGVVGQADHPVMAAAFEAVAAAAATHGKHWGLGGVSDDALMRHYIAMGARMLFGPPDRMILKAGAANAARALRALVADA